jgi:hypothetical protein
MSRVSAMERPFSSAEARDHPCRRLAGEAPYHCRDHEHAALTEDLGVHDVDHELRRRLRLAYGEGQRERTQRELGDEVEEIEGVTGP